MDKTDVMLLTVNEMAQLLRIGRSSAYELCRQRAFPVVRIGKSIRIPLQALYVWIEQQSKQDDVDFR